MRQPKGEGIIPMPVFYFSELAAHAFGSSNMKKWGPKHFVDPTAMLSERGLLA
jgi:hypothetical protein